MGIRGTLGLSPQRTVGMDTATASIVLVVGLGLLSVSTASSAVLALMVPLAVVSASGLYLLVQRYGAAGATIEAARLSARTGHVLRLATIVGLAGLVFVAALTGGRTVPFFGVATLVAVLVFVRIFFVTRPALRPAVLLAEIVAFAAVLRWVALLSTPGLIGIDAWVHVPNYAASIRQAGQLSAIDHTKYFGAPLYHLLVVVAAETFGSTLRTGLYATLGVVMPLATLFVFYTAKYVVPVRWALFAAAAFAISGRFVLWGIHLIPTSLGLVFFVGVVYGTATVYSTSRSRWMYAITLLFGLATVLTHQISTFILLVFLGTGALAQLSVRLFDGKFGIGGPATTGKHVNFAGLFAVLLPVTVADWTLTSPGETTFLGGMLAKAQARLGSIAFVDAQGWESEAVESLGGVITTVPTSVLVVYSLGLSILLALGLLGVFTVLGGERLDALSLTWVVSMGVMTVVALGMPMLDLEFLVSSRWIAFVYVAMVLLGAYGLWHLESTLGPRQAAAVLSAILLLFAGPMLVNHKATVENPVFEDGQITPAYSESELQGAETIATIHSAGTAVQADKPFYLLLRDWQTMDTEPLNLTADGTVAGDGVVYRRALSERSPIVEHRGRELRVELPPEAVCVPEKDVDYDNGDVRYCTEV